MPRPGQSASRRVWPRSKPGPTGYLHDALALRVARQKGVVDTLYQVERSHVPFPDEPPIVYPDAEVWQELTARRIGEVQVDGPGQPRGPAEKKITEALQVAHPTGVHRDAACRTWSTT